MFPLRARTPLDARECELSNAPCLGDLSSSAQRLLDSRLQQPNVEDNDEHPNEDNVVDKKTGEEVGQRDKAVLGLSLDQAPSASSLSSAQLTERLPFTVLR